MIRYVIYSGATSAIVAHPRTRRTLYHTASAAKAAKTRMERDWPTIFTPGVEYGIADLETYHNEIEQTETVHNLMSGKPVEQSVNTPRCCDPSSELYWSM